VRASPGVVAGALVGVIASAALLGGAAPAGADRAAGETVLTFADPEIVESSGLVASGGLFHTVNDSGDTGRVFSVDESGATVGVTTWSADAVDVEALAPGGPEAPEEVWVADIGDNRGARESVSVTRVPVGRGETDATDAPSYTLVYPDGARDAETLAVDPGDGRLYVASKGVLGGELFRAPADLDPDAPNELEPVGPVLGLATDGAFTPDGRHLVIRSYARAVVYAMPEAEAVASFTLPDQPQGEGLAVDADGRVLLTTEGAGTDLLAVTVPADVRALLDGDAASEGPSDEPTEDAEAEPAPEPAEETDEPADDESGWDPMQLLGGVALLAVAVLVGVWSRGFNRR